MADLQGSQQAGIPEPPKPEQPWRAMRPDRQAFDRVVIDTIPRWKESELSGDEWRISARIEFWRKGRVLHSQGSGSVQSACDYLGYYHMATCESGKAALKDEENYCDQEGCSNLASITYRLKAEYCHHGHKTEPHRPTIRRFCKRHKSRGDCGLEDGDSNYELVQDISTPNMPPRTLTVREALARLAMLEDGLESMAQMGGFTKLHPDENEVREVQGAFSEGAAFVFNDLSSMARTLLNSRPDIDYD